MPARIGQLAPDPYRPASMTDMMAECPTCGVEWGWGASWEVLQQLIADHNTARHNLT